MAAGSIFAVLQAAGAVGLTITTKLVIGAMAATLGAWAMDGKCEDI